MEDNVFVNKLFGTDGIRGPANQWPIVPDMVVKIGRAVVHYLQENKKQRRKTVEELDFHPYKKHTNEPYKLTAVIGKDTRLSGYMIESALMAGLIAQGCNVVLLGPLPTPAISMLTRSLRADIGIMISASHNPYQDNGIKFFDSEGMKFNKQTEIEIEKIIFEHELKYPEDCGCAIRLDDAAGRYVEFAKSTFPKGKTLEGMKIIVDCANGAAYRVAPKVLWELGASVIAINDKPDGKNINEKCGVVDCESLRKTVQEKNFDIGIALDGDADRIVIVTPSGYIVNGDQILALLAQNWNMQNLLSNGVVSTVVSNLGLKKFLSSLEIKHFESGVGDKNVMDMMYKNNCILGGERSGHIISSYSTTGDAIIAALQVLRVVIEKDKKIDKLFPVFEEIPHFSKNIPRAEYFTDNFLVSIKEKILAILDGKGNVVIRRSGTEPVIKVLIQCEEENLLKSAVEVLEKLLLNQAMNKE